jgi:hypothetical protein
MKFRLIFFSAILIFVTIDISAQYYDTGQDPARLKWLQIKTNRFRIIYPENYGSQGIEFARELDNAYSDLTTLYNAKKFRLPVIIHNYTIQSNGYVAWAPKRMEIYPTPEQNGIPLATNKQLAIHEMAHVFQMETLNRGITKALSLFSGEQFPGAVASLLPLWYMEGSAVFAESFLTQAGRGRSPSFQKQLKAISLEKGKMYKYDKIINGSFRNFIPDHYTTGFQMVTWSSLKYNPDIWNRVLKLTGNMPLLLNPVNLSLLHTTGLTKKKLFTETFDSLKIIWTKESIKNNPVRYESVNPPKKKNYVNYYSPVCTDDNSVIAIKTSLYNPPQFVLIDLKAKSEKRLHVPGNIYPFLISASYSMIVWVETQRDPRWNNRNYSVIKTLNLHDKTVRQITWKSRYLSASISPDGKTIAATENTAENKNNLVFINARSERIIRSFPAPGNVYLQRPQWSDDGTELTVISLAGAGEGILKFNVSDQKWVTLIREENTDFQSSFLRNDSLFFVSSVSGTENIYVRTPENKITVITNSQFGATDLVVEGGNIMFSDYSSSGNNLCVLHLPEIQKNNPISIAPYSYQVDRIVKPELGAGVIKGTEYIPEKYRKWQHPFRIHSWMPFYADLDLIKSDPRAIKPGFTILSQNHLSTVTSILGYEYSDRLHKLHSKLILKGWYPVFEIKVDYGQQNEVYKVGENVNNPVSVMPGLNLMNSVYLPLTFSSGRFIQNLYPSISVSYQNSYIYIKEKETYDFGQTALLARFYFSNYHISAFRDINPRWAQVVDLNFSFYPFDRNIFGPTITLKSALYFPGILRNNGIRLRYESDKQFVEKIPLMNRINYPRSYKGIVSEDLNFFSIDYVAPLIYPDFNLFSLLYLPRIRTDLFYDYATGTGNYHPEYNNGTKVYQYTSGTEIFSSFGIELLADFYILRLPYMVSSGARTTWQRGSRNPTFEFLFNIDIYGMNIGRNRY